MKGASVAGRYAQALFIVTEKRGETDRAQGDLSSVAALVAPGSAVGELLASPLVLTSDKRKAVRAVLESRALPSVVLFLDLLLRKKRLADLPAITLQYDALVEKKQGVRRAQVVSAVPLSPAELERLRAAIATRLGATVKLTSAVDPELIGGVTVRIGDRVLDGSIENQLARLSRELYDVTV